MSQRSTSHVPLPACPSFRHLAHPGYTCAEEDLLRIRIAAHRGPRTQPTIPARALAGTTFGPAPTRSA